MLINFNIEPEYRSVRRRRMMVDETLAVIGGDRSSAD